MWAKPFPYPERLTMTDDNKPAFEFDSLPGDASKDGDTAKEVMPAESQLHRPQPVIQPAAPPVERKRRGPKKGSARKPRVTRTVLVHPGDPDFELKEVADAQAAAGFSDEYDFIRAMMQLTEAKRQHVLAVLNKVFGE
jgi:hypothetical protein